MATYLDGNQDYLPELQPFQPDLNYYAGVLSTKQTQYDQGLSKINSLYGSSLNSPMLRGDNIQRRDQYFKTIEQDLQKTAGMDLSIDSNVEAAKTLFDPILNDQSIVKDMVYTKQLNNSYQTAEQFRNCVDPDKCGGEFWNEGVQALDFAKEEFINASPDDALRSQAPKYVPRINVTRKAIAAAKDAGFNITYEYNDGKYNITDTNGQLLLGPDGNGILPQYLLGMFGNDASVQNMYSTQAYVQRKSFAKQYAAENGITEDAAESFYINNIISKSVPTLQKSAEDFNRMRDKLDTDSKMLQVGANQQGGIIEGDGIQESYDRLQGLLEQTKDTAAYHEGVTNLINTTPNLNDIKLLRNRADNIVANSMFGQAINDAAIEYAMGTGKHEMKADPYALAAYNNSLDLSKGIALQNHEFAIWQQKEEYKGNATEKALAGILGVTPQGKINIGKALSDAGITAEKLQKENIPINPRDWTAEDLKKLKSGGLGQPIVGKLKDVQSIEDFTPVEDTYVENSKLFVESVDNLKSSTTNYLKESFSAMKEAYLKPVGNSAEEKNTVRTKIYNNLNSILAGSGIAPEQILNGTLNMDSVVNTLNKSSKHVQRAVGLHEKDIATQVITNQWSPDALAKYQTAKQVAEGFYARKKADNQVILNDLKSDAAASVDAEVLFNSKGKKDIQEVIGAGFAYDEQKLKADKQNALIDAIANQDGLLTKAEARQRYIAMSNNLYKNDPDHIEHYDKNDYQKVSGTTAQEKASKDFDDNYEAMVNKYTSKVPSWRSAAGSSDNGGVLAVGKSMEFGVNGDQRFSPSYMQVEKLANEIPNIPELTYEDSAKQAAAEKLFEAIRSGDTKGLDFTYDLKRQPRGVTSKGVTVEPGVILSANLSDKTVRTLFGLKADDDLTPYKNFVVKIPQGTSSTADAFLQKTTASNVDVYMLQNGSKLSQNIPNLGNYTITRKGPNMVFSGTRPIVNPLANKIENKPFTNDDGSQDINLGNVTPEEAIKIGNNLLEVQGRFTTEDKKIFLNQSQNGGGTR